MQTRSSTRWQNTPGSFDPLHTAQLFPTDGNPYHIPSVPHAPLSYIPSWLVPYRTRIRSVDWAADGAVHFFLDDYRFESVWSHPHKALRYLSDFKTLLTPDFSLYPDWPVAVQIWNVYRSRWCGAYWTDAGFQVIPTVSWAGRESYDFCFAGIARRSVVALSAVGVRAVEGSRFEHGFRAMVECIEPSRVLCYGAIRPELKKLVEVMCYPTRWDGIVSARRQHGGRGTSSPVAKYTVRAGSGTLPPGQGREDEEKGQVAAEAERETGAAASSVDTSAASVNTAGRPQSEQVSASAVSDQASAAPATPAQDESELPYVTIINQETALGGAIYPFLEQTGRAWAVVSHDLEDPTSYPRKGTFGMSKPTLRYVKDGKIEDVFVDGMTTEQFLAKTGLQLGMDKGGFVLSKRLSRVMRPYFASGSFDSRTVNIRYLEQDETQKKVWDGAGLISRAMVERLMIPDGTPPAKRAELLREIAQCKRIEFTVMTERGQDKGHAIVSDDLDADFVLPMDTKKEVKLVNGQTWVGVNFVHAHDDMRIDIQSLINLHPFFSEDQYAQWLEDEGNLFAHAVESGQVDAAMQRIDPFATMEDVEAWHLREYFASGGHAMWSASVTRNLMNQHLKRLNETTLDKMRLPIPGGRYYVLPVGVGQAAGFKHDIPRGHVRIDAEYGTAWVNDEDWVAMQDSPAGKGIRDILGGADNDDALWVHPFTDHDGEQKMLCWRSPNQAGEYIVLKPTLGSRVLAWETVDGEVTFSPGDSRTLFARTDTVDRAYLGLIDPNSTTGLGKGKPYSIEVMDETIERAKANGGGLGMYCNLLMLSKALYGGLPKNPPAPLEDFIDSTVKTGADVSKGRDWCYDASQRIIASGRAVPHLLVQRLSASKRDKATVPLTMDHWVDTLYGKVKAHIDAFRQQRDDLVSRTMPPAALFDHAFNADERVHIQNGVELNKLYSVTRGKLLHNKRAGQRLDEADMQVIREQLDHFLSRFNETEHGAILRGALVATYLSDEPSDAALWMLGEKTEQGTRPGMAQRTIAALREVGVLDEVGTIDGSVARYPGATLSEPTFARSIGIQGVWFNWYCAQQRAKGLPVPAQLSDVPKADMKAAKVQITDLILQPELHQGGEPVE